MQNMSCGSKRLGNTKYKINYNKNTIKLKDFGCREVCVWKGSEA